MKLSGVRQRIGLQPFGWGIIVGYIGAIVGAGRLDAAHLGLLIAIALLYGAHRRTRAFLTALFPMLTYLLVYDLVHLIPMAYRQPVFVEPLYRWETICFRFHVGGQPFLPHEWFLSHHWRVVDCLAAIPYQLHFWVPICFAIILWRRDRATAGRFAWAFAILNLWALSIQLSFPTAPPWYVNQFGFSPADPLLPGDPGALARVDALIGHPYFADIYRMSAIVFGAMPSMHAAWPILIGCYMPSFGRTWKVVLLLYGVMMWIAAVYLQHHYVVDLLAGGGMAIAVWVGQRCLCRRGHECINLGRDNKVVAGETAERVR